MNKYVETYKNLGARTRNIISAFSKGRQTLAQLEDTTFFASNQIQGESKPL